MLYAALTADRVHHHRMVHDFWGSGLCLILLVVSLGYDSGGHHHDLRVYLLHPYDFCLSNKTDLWGDI